MTHWTLTVTALREQLRTQEQHYKTKIAELEADNKTPGQSLAAAHGELHRLGKTGASDASRRG